MFIPTALQYQVSKHLAMCHTVLHIIADTLSISVERDLVEDMILNEGRDTKHFAALRLMQLFPVIGENTFLASLQKDLQLINSGLKVLTATKEDYNRLYFFDENSKLLLPK